MQKKNLRFGVGFRVQLGTKQSQAAEMVLKPGDSEGDPKNKHKGADQWLFVVEGTGTAIVNGKRYPIKAGTLLLIEKGDRHQIKNTGTTNLATLNLYVPPAYTKKGDPLPRGKPS